MAVALASLTAALVGILAVERLGSLRDARAEELDTALPYMNALGLTAKATANDERGYLLAADPSFQEGVDKRLAKIDGLSDDARAAAAPTSADAAYLDELEAGVEAWLASLDVEFAMLSTDRPTGTERWH